jgi:polyisoprenoid-binding protein YceI
VGRFEKFSGTFSDSHKTSAAAKVSIEIDTVSINSSHAERYKHLRAAEFLDVTQYPKAMFLSNSVTPESNGKAKIVGDFTFLGVTKPITVDARLVDGGEDPWISCHQGLVQESKPVLDGFGVLWEPGPASKAVELDLHVEGVRK